MSRPGYLIWGVVLLLGQEGQHAAPAGVRKQSVQTGMQLQPIDAHQEALQEKKIARRGASLKRSAMPDQRNRIPLSIPTCPEKEC